MNIISICALAVCISVLILSVRQIKPDMAHVLSIASAILLFLAVIPYINEAISQIKEFSHINIGSAKYLEPIIKITGIAYITNISSQLCADAGETALASRVEMAGKVAICMLTIPIAREAFTKITGILQ
ncbi:MAG: stage III sporulation protein AD [Clostridia bacterium]|nr:stage III sporulation protein AD [Clostridia bacterium]